MKVKIVRWVGIALVTFAVGCRRQPVALGQLQLLEAFRSNWITRVQIIYDPRSPYLHEVRGQMLKPEQRAGVAFVAKVRLTEEMEEEMLASKLFGCKLDR